VNDKVRYDAACKRLLSEKIILAWVMKNCMSEYKNYSIQEIAEQYIEGTPQISKVPVAPEETNTTRISGTGVEDPSITEGTITYDIRFFAFLPDSKKRIHLIINQHRSTK